MLSSFASSDTLPPHFLLAGRYRILRKAGEGGFGIVYQAQDTRQKKMVAVKQINLGALSTRQIIEATDSYNREVMLLPRLHHKNLPRVYDNFTDPTHWYLVMEYIEGETLEDYLQKAKDGHLSTGEVANIGIQLSNVLDYLHRQKPAVIFRDVKPANIMRTHKGHLYLIDFGIARLFNPEKTRDTGPLGSPGYAAPEQYGKAQSTEKTDIFGLGATLQTLLTGKDPSDPATAGAPLPVLNKNAQRLQQLFEQMQAPFPANRPRSMDDVRKKLLYMQADKSDVFPLLRYWRSFVVGLLIGSLPYTFLPIVYPALNVPVLAYIVGFPLYIVTMFFFSIWPAFLVGQLLTSFLLVFKPRKRFLAFGILIMLVLVYLAIYLRWLPPPPQLFGGFGY